jgi:hypothetical protein
MPRNGLPSAQLSDLPDGLREGCFATEAVAAHADGVDGQFSRIANLDNLDA